MLLMNSSASSQTRRSSAEVVLGLVVAEGPTRHLSTHEPKALIGHGELNPNAVIEVSSNLTFTNTPRPHEQGKTNSNRDASDHRPLAMAAHSRSVDCVRTLSNP